MPIGMINDPVQRIGVIKGRILKHAKPYICLGVVGVNENFQRNAGDTVKYRRFLPKGHLRHNLTASFWMLTEIVAKLMLMRT